MYICTTYTTDHADPDCVTDSIIAKGDTLASIIPEVVSVITESDPQYASFVSDQYDNPIEPDQQSLTEALKSGTSCIVVNWNSYIDVYTIHVV